MCRQACMRIHTALVYNGVCLAVCIRTHACGHQHSAPLQRTVYNSLQRYYMYVP